MIGPKHAQLAAIKDAINTFIDRANDITFRRNSGLGNPQKNRARALVEMDKAILGAILFDWQPMETMPKGVGSYTHYVVFEDVKTGNRHMESVWADAKGELFYHTDGDDTIHKDFRAIAWSREPDSKALGGK